MVGLKGFFGASALEQVLKTDLEEESFHGATKILFQSFPSLN
jgi:hypothetical protein